MIPGKVSHIQEHSFTNIHVCFLKISDTLNTQYHKYIQEHKICDFSLTKHKSINQIIRGFGDTIPYPAGKNLFLWCILACKYISYYLTKLGTMMSNPGLINSRTSATPMEYVYRFKRVNDFDSILRFHLRQSHDVNVGVLTEYGLSWTWNDAKKGKLWITMILWICFDGRLICGLVFIQDGWVLAQDDDIKKYLYFMECGLGHANC